MRKALGLLLLSGCSTAYLVAKGGHMAVEDGSVTMENPKPYRRLMVLMPHSDHGVPSALVNALESHLVGRGIRVISAGVTGRVVSEGPSGGDASRLTDVERALILARRSGADALLQVLSLGEDSAGGRTFYQKGNVLLETPPGVTGGRVDVRLGSARVVLRGQLVDVETGEVVHVFNIAQSLVRELDHDYREHCQDYGDHVTCGGQPFATDGERDAAAARAWGSIMNVMTERIVTGHGAQ